MRSIEGWLKAGDVAARTIALETRVEEDLLGLVEAIRRLPPTTPPAPGAPLSADPRERERELNRLVAELKMVRMIQARLNDDTVGVDKTRPAGRNLAARPSGARSRRWKPPRTRFATRSRRSPNGCHFPTACN